MSINATYPIRIDSTLNEYSPNFTPRGVVIANYSADNLAFDNSVDPVLLIPPGVQCPIAIHHYVSTLRVRSASNTTGYATITIMDSEPDTTGAPNLQQLPGTITATIPSAVTVSGGVTTTPAPGSNQAVTLTGPVTIAASSVTLPVSDLASITLANGLLPAAVTPFSIGINGSFSQLFNRAVAGFAIFLSAIDNGFLSVYYTSGGNTIYLLRRISFYNAGAVASARTVERQFVAPIPAGATVTVQMEQNLGVAVTGVLKW